MHFFSDFSHLLHKMHEVTGGRNLLQFLSIFSTFAYPLHRMSAGRVSCAWMKGEAPGSLLCQLGVSFLPAGFWIPPSRCRSHPFILLQLRCCKVLCPACWCSPPWLLWDVEEHSRQGWDLAVFMTPSLSLSNSVSFGEKRFSNSVPQFPRENGENRGIKM